MFALFTVTGLLKASDRGSYKMRYVAARYTFKSGATRQPHSGPRGSLSEIDIKLNAIFAFRSTCIPGPAELRAEIFGTRLTDDMQAEGQ